MIGEGDGFATRRVASFTQRQIQPGCHHRPVPTQTTPEHPPAVKRPRSTRTTKSSARAEPGTPPVAETGAQRARREADDDFRMLLSGHISEMRHRGVGDDVLGPFERELLRMGPARSAR
jgi:hypothetical protein